MREPLQISVVTATFNSAATIVDTLRSVASQTYENVEHIIIDGASTDATLELVKAHIERVAKCVSERDCGIYDAMNKGWRQATGDVIGFLNSDDVYASDDALDLIAAAFSDESIDACYGDLVYVAREDVNKHIRYWRSCSFQAGLCARGWQPPHPTLYVRRSAFERFGGFDLTYKIQSDFEFCLRMLEVARLQSVYIPRLLVKMRTGGVSNASIRNIIRGNLEALDACRKNGVRAAPAFVVRKIVSKIPQYFSRPPAID
ncbi:MAG: glycosyltransferase family 2 protein [Steroidobacter sp.]